MSHSRKKISCQQIPMMSTAQKLRHSAVQALYRRRCCEKENLNESKERKESKGKEGHSSSKKMKRKKFLEQEVQKLLQRRYTNEQIKINQIKTQNASEFQGLKVDLKQMKDVLNKLSLQEKKVPKQEKIQNQKENKAEFSTICTSYERKIDDLRVQIEILKQTNAKLQEAHIQSQLFAKQTKDYCESINRQLAELGQKHLKCEQNALQLEQKRQTIGVIQRQNQQLIVKLSKEQMQKNNIQQQLINLKSNFQNISSENKKLEQNKIRIEKNCQNLQQKLKEAEEKIISNTANYEILDSKLKEQQQLNQKYEQQIEELNLKLEESHQYYEKSIQGLKQLILKEKTWFQQQTTKLKLQLQQSEKKLNEFQKENQTYKNQIQYVEGLLATEKQRVIELISKNELLVELKTKIQTELKKIQTEFNNTKQDLGNTKQKLGSLSSMQKKCEELYLEIKLQKQRCNNFNVETAKQRQALQNRVKQLQKDNEKYITSIQTLESQKEELQELLELQKLQSKRLMEDKIKMTKQIKEFEQKISVMQRNKLQVIKENENIMNKLVILRSEIEQKEKNWLEEKEKYQMRQLWLEKQKKQIEAEVKGTLEAIKNRTDQFQNLNSSYEEELNMLKQENTRISDNLVKANNQNENMKIALNAKQSKLNQLQLALNQNESVQKIMKEKLHQFESNSKNLNIEWQNRYSALQNNYQKLQREFKQNQKCFGIELRQWKEKYAVKQKELNEKDGKIENLSTIRENLQSRLQDTQERLHQTETIRLSLSSQLQSQMQTTRRNQEMLEEEKVMLQNELKLKNKNISQLKQTIKMVRNESLQIKEEVAEYNKLIDLEQLVGSQVKCIQQSLKYLKRQKDELQLAINILKSQNNELSNKIYAIENDDLQWPQREARFKDTILHLQRKLQTINTQKAKLMQQLNNQKEETRRLANTLEQQKCLTSVRIVQSQTTINSTKMILEQQSQKCQKLTMLLKERDNIIKEQAQKLKLNEEKRIKIINEVHSIQNQISQIGIKNNQLQEEKAELQQQLTKKEQQISLLSQKISILLQNNSVLEVQKVAYSQQEVLLRNEIKQWSQRLKMINQSSQKKVDQIYEIYEARKNEAVNVLKQKIKQLATQLSNCMNKFKNKCKDIQLFQQKYASLQKLLQENHELLQQQRKERQRVMMAHNQSMIQIDNLKIIASSKEKENQTLVRDKTILREKLLEQESRYQILRRKYQFLDQQRYNVQKEKENQNIELRVLKEENKNIEKVMNDQINQHKGIIEQLVVEKRMLYAQLNQQR